MEFCEKFDVIQGDERQMQRKLHKDMENCKLHAISTLHIVELRKMKNVTEKFHSENFNH